MARIDNALLFKRNSSIDLRHITLIIFSIVVMFFDSHYRYLNIIRYVVSTTVYPIQYAVHYPHKLYYEVKENFKSYATLLKENKVYRDNELKLEAKFLQYQSLVKENNRLRALLKSSPKANEEMTISSLLAVATDPLQQILKLAKGQRQNVELGQPVFDASGVLGQIMRVGPSTSEVLLITDARSAIPVVNARNGIRSIAVGTNSTDFMKLLHISNTANIRKGDLFVTSGMGQRFPEGYPVGIVEEITQLPGEGFAEVIIKPSAHIDRVRFVLLVKSRKQTT